MHDLVIKGAKIIDGTGGAGYCGDIAIEQGRFVQVGS